MTQPSSLPTCLVTRRLKQASLSATRNIVRIVLLFFNDHIFSFQVSILRVGEI
jgi:hypothetical protein